MGTLPSTKRIYGVNKSMIHLTPTECIADGFLIYKNLNSLSSIDQAKANKVADALSRRNLLLTILRLEVGM